MNKDYSKFKEKYLDSLDVDNVIGEQMIGKQMTEPWLKKPDVFDDIELLSKPISELTEEDMRKMPHIGNGNGKAT